MKMYADLKIRLLSNHAKISCLIDNRFRKLLNCRVDLQKIRKNPKSRVFFPINCQAKVKLIFL